MHVAVVVTTARLQILFPLSFCLYSLQPNYPQVLLAPLLCSSILLHFLSLTSSVGIIIAASIVVAAGIALYESPQVRQWVDQSRRKLAVALHSLGDDIQPRRPSESSDEHYDRQRKRDEIVRRNRNELIRRARDEGIAVDLDELARIGNENIEMAERRSRADRTKSFDDMVGSDGMLKQNANATGNDASHNGVKRRGAAGFSAGAAAGAAMANPFSDDHVHLDRDDDDEAPSPKPFTYIEPGTRESSATVERDATSSPPTAAPLIDLTPDSVHPEQSNHEETDQAAQSFYSFTSSTSAADPAHSQIFDDDRDHVSAGTLTPRSERSHSIATAASIADSQADDIAVLSAQNDTDHDARSDVASESGFTDGGFSEGGFSEFEQGDRTGVMTPNSWTDVGSGDESEWGGPQGNGQVSQLHQ